MAGAKDRRERRLYPTLAGRELSLALSEPQSLRIAHAMEDLTPGNREAVKEFLKKMRGRDESLPPADDV
jgi:DNA-binding MarR family transcriptional regulator